jgi:hypothetical protein
VSLQRLGLEVSHGISCLISGCDFSSRKDQFERLSVEERMENELANTLGSKIEVERLTWADTEVKT